MEKAKGALIETNIGPFAIELYWKHAPLACESFSILIEKEFYVNCLFHRLIKDYIAQTGDPTGTGRGGISGFDLLQSAVAGAASSETVSSSKGFPDELHPDLKHVGAGIVSMANSGSPNTNKSQFFITLAPTPALDGKHTIFGRISAGMKTIKKVSLTATDKNDRPIAPIVIEKTSLYYTDEPDMEAAAKRFLEKAKE